MILEYNLKIIVLLGEPENIVQEEPVAVVIPRPGNRLQNRTALRRNNRNVLSK